MAYLISPLPTKPDLTRQYVLDANIWFFLLFRKHKNVRSAEDGYRNFIHSFGKHCVKQGPIIKLPCFIFSEVLNRALRGIYYRNFFEIVKKEIRQGSKKYDGIDEKDYYKKLYKTSSQYLEDYKKIVSDIQSFSTFFEFQSDGIDRIINNQDMSDIPHQTLDFPDYMLLNFAKNNNYILLTDDGDFNVENVEILTLNEKLLKKSN